MCLETGREIECTVRIQCVSRLTAKMNALYKSSVSRLAEKMNVLSESSVFQDWQRNALYKSSVFQGWLRN